MSTRRITTMVRAKSNKKPDPKATSDTRRRYQRIAPIYELMEMVPARRYKSWRERLWSLVEEPNILEVGVGTGKNILYYPEDLEVTAFDLASRMIQRARKRVDELDMDVDLQVEDVQDLDFPDESFDTVVATFVFCSVPDPVLGLQEVQRVLKPGLGRSQIC